MINPISADQLGKLGVVTGFLGSLYAYQSSDVGYALLAAGTTACVVSVALMYSSKRYKTGEAA